MNKRTSIKGKGAAIFLEDEKQDIDDKENKKPNSPNQTKVTYFINESTSDNLEDVWLSLRRKFRTRKLSKSKIVEVALNILIKDWEENQENSRIENFIKTSVK